MSNPTIIHKKQVSSGVTAYYFTKSKNRCLRIEYDKQWHFGKSPSGARLTDIEIHYQNSFMTDELQEIELSDVPSVIVDILSYLL